MTNYSYLKIGRTMIDDGTLYRLGEHNFRWICGADYSGEWLRDLADKLNLNVNVKTSTDQLHNISVQGPNSRKLLSKIIWTPPAHPDVNDLQWFHFSISRIHDHLGVPIMLSRTGYTGELGYEIYCHPKDAVKLWDAIWDAGKEFNLVPMGFEALDMLRIEAVGGQLNAYTSRENTAYYAKVLKEEIGRAHV